MKNVLEYLEQSAAMMPDKCAVIDVNESLSFAELLERSQHIGSFLATKVSPREPILVLMEKSVATLSTFLGITQAGAFIINITADLPLQRIQSIVDISKAHWLIHDGSVGFEGLDFAGVCLDYRDLQNAPINEQLLHGVRQQALDTDPLYCNFTSGSTGIPKGVLIAHQSVIDFMDSFTDLFAIGPDDVIGNQAPLNFDVSIKDIFSALKVGATLVLIPKKHFSVVMELLDYLEKHRVTTLIWAVSALCLVTQFRGFRYKIPATIQKVLFSGEAMPMRYLKAWQDAYPNAQFVNLYGPTEITCNCTYYRVPNPIGDQETLPIGTPFPNERIILLDADNQSVVAPNVKGELCVSGRCLALGYYNNPAMTTKAFIQNPHHDAYPDRWYRTGDVAYYGEDGLLYFAGRVDFQIKHMGFRIELEDVEAALHGLERVGRAACLYDEQKARIIAFYVGDKSETDLKIELEAILPPYMIPHTLKRLDEMPLSNNGKINRQGLKQLYEGGTH